MLTLSPVVVKPRDSKFSAVGLLEQELAGKVVDGDVVVLSSKFVAISEGRLVRLADVKPSSEARRLAAAFRMDPRLAELVLEESDEVVGGVPGFMLAIKDGLLTPNSGIDKSNVKHGWVVLYPRRPEASAKRIREGLKLSLGVEIGVVVCDSRLSPTRRGTTGVAVASSGLEAIVDMRGRTDLFGNVLRVTSQAVADDLSSAAELLMGESDEATPIVVVRGLDRRLISDAEFPSRRFSIPTEQCVYLRSLGYGAGGRKPAYVFKRRRADGPR